MISDHKEVMMMLISSARMIAITDLDTAIKNAERGLDIGPILDPTLWRNKHKDLEEDLEFLRAALPFWREVKRRIELGKDRSGLAEPA